jgi:hypothetical protein
MVQDHGTCNAAAKAAAVCAACGQPLRSEAQRKRNRFILGMVLAWVPFLPLVNVFRGLSENKATGVGAVAGGFAEVGATYFLLLAPVCIVAAFVLLLRSFSRGHPLRTFFAVVSLGWTALVTIALVLFAAALVFLRPYVG